MASPQQNQRKGTFVLVAVALGLLAFLSSLHTARAFSSARTHRPLQRRAFGFLPTTGSEAPYSLRTGNDDCRHASAGAGCVALFMSSPSKKKEKVKSGRKELAYDEETGRFFENDETECIPDDEYCLLDKDTGKYIRLTVEEKERIFLDSLQAYYTSGRQLLSDEEFDLLKEDLQWNGSDMVVMNRKEAQYLAAMQEYLKGTPVMPDAEFDSLKRELMEEGSKFAVQTEPKCYIDTGICKATFQEDRFRSNLLYLPAGALLTLLWLGIGFEVIEPVIRLNPIFLTLLGSPLIYNGSKFITEELVFVNKFVAYGQCPSCGFENRVYFGDILGVEGFKDVSESKCPNCKEVFRVQRATLRASTLPKA